MRKGTFWCWLFGHRFPRTALKTDLTRLLECLAAMHHVSYTTAGVKGGTMYPSEIHAAVMGLILALREQTEPVTTCVRCGAELTNGA